MLPGYLVQQDIARPLLQMLQLMYLNKSPTHSLMAHVDAFAYCFAVCGVSATGEPLHRPQRMAITSKLLDSQLQLLGN